MVNSSVNRLCIFCQEEIRPGAVICCHCGGSLAPLQALADQNAELLARITLLENEFATWRKGEPRPETGLTSPNEEREALPAELRPGILNWPHMADNILLGLVTLLVVHWIATTLPIGNRTTFRIVALIVAMPFGFRFQTYARTGTTGQILAALAFASTGTLLNGVVDLLVRPHGIPTIVAADVVASFATIFLSHFAGSTLGHFRLVQTDRREAMAVDRTRLADPGGAGLRIRLAPSEIKTTADTVKAVFEAATPAAAGAAALWAAFGRFLS